MNAIVLAFLNYSTVEPPADGDEAGADIARADPHDRDHDHDGGRQGHRPNHE
ncbi:hypothetical protein AB0F17_42945 [Nonomuraea sp. NPDC026600]|uniref:hypothetical protein n=1 Tax=Nonomuraea sp. NPDC026600 TaxID=3155363 RepID=UPI0033C8C341